MDEIEQQLERQRLKSRRTVGIEAEQQRQQSTNLGDYVWDEERGTYFPKEYQGNRQTEAPVIVDEVPVGGVRHPHEPYLLWGTEGGRWPSHVLMARSLCTSPLARRRLTERWRAQLLCQTVRITPDAMFPEDLVAEDIGGHCPDATMSGKYQLPAWCRTFDVANVNNDKHQLPSLVTLTETGMRSRTRDVAEDLACLSVLKSPMIGIRFVRTSGRNTFANNKKSILALTATKLIIVDPPSTVLFEIEEPLNDAVVWSNEIVLALDDHEAGGYMRINRDGHRLLDKFRGVPKTSTTTVELDSNNEKCIWLGHKNGQISRCDKYSDRVCGASETTAEHGNVLRMHPLAHHPTQILVRHATNGLIRLYEARMFGRGTASGDRSVVAEFELPRNIAPLDTGRCNGLALDPSESIVFSPFVNKERRPCLGMWSTVTGELVGDVALCKGRPTPPSNSAPTIVELNGTVTNGWTRQRSTDTDQDEPRKERGTFGLWYKLEMGQNYERTMPDQQPLSCDGPGNIHHVLFDGSCTSSYSARSTIDT